MPSIYQHRHRGPAIVLGAAVSALDDLAAALALRPGAEILGVNFTGMLDARIRHVWTQHAELSIVCKSVALSPIWLHARPRDHRKPDGQWCQPAPLDQWEALDYEWPTLAFVSGGGGIAAAMWARLGMGFDEVILAGCPLEQGNGGIIPGYPDEPFRDSSIDRWQRIALAHASSGNLTGVRSMSGWTREVLGAPA